MAREIKYRLPWFKNSDDSFSHFTYWGRIDHKGNYSDDCFTSPGQVSSCYYKDDQQFTGLQDCNGKEIYEGDILKLQYPINYGFGGIHNREIIVKISFDNGSFWFSGEGFTGCNWHFYNEYEIIGNVYEHPELLNK